MNVADEILELLESSGAPLSGEEMARQLGVSRNAVWKAVQRLREDGYQIEAATNRGYQLVSADNALTPQSVRRLLEGPAQSCAIEVRDSVTSTNTVLKSIAEQGGAEGMALIAQQQTQGKGRLGRSFLSPKGTGLYLSVLLRPRFPAEEALSITTAAAVVMERASSAGKRGRSKTLRYSPVPLGERKLRPRRPLPWVCCWAMRAIPSAPPCSAMLLSTVLVEVTESRTSMAQLWAGPSSRRRTLWGVRALSAETS